jgi:hypothetical protein
VQRVVSFSCPKKKESENCTAGAFSIVDVFIESQCDVLFLCFREFREYQDPVGFRDHQDPVGLGKWEKFKFQICGGLWMADGAPIGNALELA